MIYPTLPNAVSSYGASMGRSDTILDPGEAMKFRLYRMPMVDGGCYDTGGAYWGASVPTGDGYMWHALADGPTGRNEVFLRAWTRIAAKAKVRSLFRNARFYR
jgi:hypothetical protein